ncbi:hypothetical protein VTI74DRAFT_10805 [Chaetomium olivicolor]
MARCRPIQARGNIKDEQEKEMGAFNIKVELRRHRSSISSTHPFRHKQSSLSFRELARPLRWRVSPDAPLSIEEWWQELRTCFTPACRADAEQRNDLNYRVARLRHDYSLDGAQLRPTTPQFELCPGKFYVRMAGNPTLRISGCTCLSERKLGLRTSGGFWHLKSAPMSNDLGSESLGPEVTLHL